MSHVLAPYDAFLHLKETLVGYLETAYKISNADVFGERRRLLEQVGAVTQPPLIETTPGYPKNRYLADVARSRCNEIADQLVELVGFGTPLRREKLWTHQDKAIDRAIGANSNLIVATGTASGKTEIFLIPILARLLSEAKGWPAPLRPPRRGAWDQNSNLWMHARRHERRCAALRAIILYPTNALVNDQLRRLRRILGSDASEAWQLSHLSRNCLYFGMYTSETDPTGHPSNEYRRRYWESVRTDTAVAWAAMSGDLKSTGGWPRLDGPEMLCRWDMQMAPPDILITNYSMLEYMLVRPIEGPVFQLTSDWLRKTPGAKFTLVLDEAHTYRGARGTEIALLIRRLKERLGIASGDGKLHCIATSASLPSSEHDNRLTAFAAKLFGEDEKHFYVVTLDGEKRDGRAPKPSMSELEAFCYVSQNLDLRNPLPALVRVGADLSLPLSTDTNPAIQAYKLLSEHPQLVALRERAARRATGLEELADHLWGNLGTSEMRREATAGMLALGALARPSDDADAQPLISSRLHIFARGVPGVWACMDPECRCVLPDFRRGPTRPVGRLYIEPRIWCDCGARVLELFSCRVCGLLFLGGIPDNTAGSLWPWSDDLEGGRQDFNDYQVFGVEEPQAGAPVEYRSTKTTTPISRGSAHARPVYPVRRATVGTNTIPFPSKCPRCNSHRQSGMEGREIIEPLRTKGSKSYSILIEDAFRLQPGRAIPFTNGGRKALAFADSRQDAAILAGDLEIDHSRDAFRQMVYRVLVACPTCLGYGSLPQIGPVVGAASNGVDSCPECGETGVSGNKQLAVQELRERLLDLAHRARLDPTMGSVAGYFSQLTPVYNPNDSAARRYMDALIRNEIAAPDFGLEPMGLASWRPLLPAPQQLGQLAPLNSTETVEFIYSIIRILSMEDVLLPPSLTHQTWPLPYVQEWDRKLLVPRGGSRGSIHVEFRLDGNTKLGRYVTAVTGRLISDGRFPDSAAADRWKAQVEGQLLLLLQSRELRILVRDKTGSGLGIPIDRFLLVSMDDAVELCTQCAYVSASSLLSVCLRCGHRTISCSPVLLRNFYRRAVGFARPGSPFPDPFPFRVQEHTAQIPKREAKRYERWYQYLFLPGEDADDSRVDALSVTTTMEMGVDIGDLLTVGMRNVPPGVANYQQRAGRAGRRGSALATVIAYALQRSHDQYYYARPPKIITDPPRVPRLYLENEVIARRHVRALVLQYFFHEWPPTRGGIAGGLMSAWGSVGDFQRNGLNDLTAWLSKMRLELSRRARSIVPDSFQANVENWIQAIPSELNGIVTNHPAIADLLVEILNSALLPRHAFPVDVVALWTGRGGGLSARQSEEGIQRDLGIALSEFAPGAEVVVKKAIYRVAGLYDLYQRNPSYSPDEVYVECRECRGVTILPISTSPPIVCPTCGNPSLTVLPMLRPPGFCSDWAEEPDGKPYHGGGRDRVGYTTPARLSLGDSSFQVPPTAFSPRLFARVRQGQLHAVNFGQAPLFGFRICPRCGRALDTGATRHTYPADIPPHKGRQAGPRAGHNCPNITPDQSRVILSHSFPSEVILLGVDLPPELDADMRSASGRAVWISFGTVVANAAAAVLDIDPDELRVGVRAVRRPGDRIHGEVFIHDTLPGGAGYASDIFESLADIFAEAQELSRNCPNVDCTGACYSCLLDYRNQWEHPLLDRSLAQGILDWVVSGKIPSLTAEEGERAVLPITEFLREHYTVETPRTIGAYYLPLIFSHPTRGQVAILPIHSLSSYPTQPDLQEVFVSGVDCRPHKTFDLYRRPFWVMNQL